MLSEIKLYIDWDNLHKKENKFLNKLNKYHNTQLSIYLDYLVNFIKEYTHTIDFTN